MKHDLKSASKKKCIFYSSFSELMNEKHREVHEGQELIEIISPTIDRNTEDESECFMSYETKADYHDLDSSIEKIQQLKRVLTLKQEGEFKKATTEFVDSYFIDIVPQIILPSIENRVKVTDDAKQILMDNKNLLFALKKVIDNISLDDNLNYEFGRIDIGHDPDIPEWKPIIISLKIKSQSFKERLRIKHMITKNAFKSLDEQARKNIYITGAI